MGRDPDAVARAFDVAERTGLVLMEAFMYRHHPQIKRARELLDEGAVGELRLVRAAFCSTLGRPDDVRWVPELGGGALLDVGCYCVSGMRLVAGEPETVFGEQTLTPSGVDVRFAGTLRFPGGVLGHFSCGMDTAPSQGLEAVGSEGSLLVSHPFTADVEGVEVRRGDDVRGDGGRADRGRARQPLPAPARELRSGRRRRGAAAARPRRRGRPGAHARRAASLSGDRAPVSLQ